MQAATHRQLLRDKVGEIGSADIHEVTPVLLGLIGASFAWHIVGHLATDGHEDVECIDGPGCVGVLQRISSVEEEGSVLVDLPVKAWCGNVEGGERPGNVGDVLQPSVSHERRRVLVDLLEQSWRGGISSDGK